MQTSNRIPGFIESRPEGAPPLEEALAIDPRFARFRAAIEMAQARIDSPKEA